jgi:hypothetical protein
MSQVFSDGRIDSNLLRDPLMQDCFESNGAANEPRNCGFGMMVSS